MLSERNFFTSMAAFTDMVEIQGAASGRTPLLSCPCYAPDVPHWPPSPASWPVAGWTMNLVGDLRDLYREMERMPTNYM